MQNNTTGMVTQKISRRSVIKASAAAGLVVPAMRMPKLTGAQDRVWQIAYLTPGLNVPFWKYLSDGIKQAAAAADQTI